MASSLLPPPSPILATPIPPTQFMSNKVLGSTAFPRLLRSPSLPCAMGNAIHSMRENQIKQAETDAHSAVLAAILIVGGSHNEANHLIQNIQCVCQLMQHGTRVSSLSEPSLLGMSVSCWTVHFVPRLPAVVCLLCRFPARLAPLAP